MSSHTCPSWPCPICESFRHRHTISSPFYQPYEGVPQGIDQPGIGEAMRIEQAKREVRQEVQRDFEEIVNTLRDTIFTLHGGDTDAALRELEDLQTKVYGWLR